MEDYVCWKRPKGRRGKARLTRLRTSTGALAGRSVGLSDFPTRAIGIEKGAKIMLKQAATVDDGVQDGPRGIDMDGGIPVGPENYDEFDFENRWTPVAFTLALNAAESEA